MPSIIEVPKITRTAGNRGMKIEEAQEYADLLGNVGENEGVLVDGTSETSVNAYGRGERVRNYLDKFEILPKDRIRVRTVEVEEGKWAACLMNKAPKSDTAETATDDASDAS